METQVKKTLQNLPENIHFDRQQAVTQLIEHLTRDFFVAVIGESGSGKSTLVNVTLSKVLATNLVRGRAGTQWRILHTMPYADPIGNLATDMMKSGQLHPGSLEAGFREQTEHRLRENSLALVDLYNEEVARSREAFNLLIVVDQKQELFRYAPFLSQNGKAGDDILYVNLLLNVISSKAPIYVIFITDTRYYEYFSRYRGLPEVMNNFRFSVPNITLDEIRNSLNAYLPDPDEDKEEFALQQAFMNALLHDFKTLQEHRDPYVLSKLNLALNLTLREWRAATIAGNNTRRPIDFYRDIGPLESVISNYLTQQVYDKLSPQQKADCETLFMALTEKGGDNRYLRRPVTLEDLRRILRRPPGEQASFSDITDILNRFNQSGEKFITLTGQTGILPSAHSIADISGESFLNTWNLLSRWIEMESLYSNVYRGLVNDALDAFAGNWSPLSAEPPSLEIENKTLWRKLSNQASNLKLKNIYSNVRTLARSARETFTITSSEAPGTQTPAHIMESSSLASGLKWKELCKPNEAWAIRYKSPAKPDLSEAQLEKLKKFFPNNPTQITHLALALAFLEDRKTKYDDQLAQKQRVVALAQRQQRRALRMAVLSVVSGIVALWFGYSSYIARHKLERVDFVKILDNNNVLNIPASVRYDRVNALIDKVSGRGIGITSKRAIIDYLNAPETGVLLMDESDPAMHDMSCKALLNIDLLFEEIKNGSDHQKSQKNLSSIFSELVSEQKKRSFTQYPYVYYAFYAHLNQRSTDTDRPTQPENSIIEVGALASNPKKKHEYAFGDKNGFICLKNRDTTSVLPNANRVIKSLGYSTDGKAIFAGTELGDIYRYDSLDLPAAVGAENRPKTHIYRDTLRKSIYFIEQLPESNLLLVSNTYEVYFLQQKPGNSQYDLYSRPRVRLPQHRVACRTWSPDRRWFFATGQDNTIIYRLDPSNRQTPIAYSARIAHPGTTILNLAIKMDTLEGNPRIWMAFGSETGQIWLSVTDTSILHGEHNLADNTIFVSYPQVHESSITGLAFNPALPQMASSSLDGAVQLWNLETRNTPFDHIRLRNLGQGISAIVYINAQELIAYENISSWLIKTTVDALKTDLDCAIQTQNKCKNGYR